MVVTKSFGDEVHFQTLEDNDPSMWPEYEQKAEFEIPDLYWLTYAIGCLIEHDHEVLGMTIGQIINKSNRRLGDLLKHAKDDTKQFPYLLEMIIESPAVHNMQ